MRWSAEHLLPLFLHGLREPHEPHRTLARTGTFELLELGGAKVFPALPLLITPLKTALNTRDVDVVSVVLKVVQQLLVCDVRIGPALLSHCKQLLPTLAIYRSKHHTDDGKPKPRAASGQSSWP